MTSSPVSSGKTKAIGALIGQAKKQNPNVDPGNVVRLGLLPVVGVSWAALHMSPFAALAYKRFSPYGDFLLHDIGTGDGIQQGDARPEEIRTPPLWGVKFRAPFLHDGRAATLLDAILMHGGEAEDSRLDFESLSPEEQDQLIAFLESL